MTSHAFGAFIHVEPSSSNDQDHIIPSAPEKARSRVYHSVHSIPDPVELDNLQWGTKLNGPSESGTASPSGYQTPRYTDLESRPTTPRNVQDSADALQSFSNPPMNRFRMVSVCLMNFGNGLSDSAPGALIPYIEKYGHTSRKEFFADDISGTIQLDTLSFPSSLLRTPLVSSLQHLL